MIRFPPNLGCGCFSSCSTDYCIQNAELKKIVKSSLQYSIHRTLYTCATLPKRLTAFINLLGNVVMLFLCVFRYSKRCLPDDFVMPKDRRLWLVWTSDSKFNGTLNVVLRIQYKVVLNFHSLGGLCDAKVCACTHVWVVAHLADLTLPWLLKNHLS